MRELIQQREPDDCVVASVAMALLRPYEEALNAAIRAVQYEPGKGGISRVEAILKELGLCDRWEDGEPVGDFICRYRSVVDPAYFRREAWGRPALFTVPSLNNPDGAHMVFWDGRKVWDPSPKRAYDSIAQLEPREAIIFRQGVVAS